MGHTELTRSAIEMVCWARVIVESRCVLVYKRRRRRGLAKDGTFKDWVVGEKGKL